VSSVGARLRNRQCLNRASAAVERRADDGVGVPDRPQLSLTLRSQIPQRTDNQGKLGHAGSVVQACNAQNAALGTRLILDARASVRAGLPETDPVAPCRAVGRRSRSNPGTALDPPRRPLHTVRAIQWRCSEIQTPGPVATRRGSGCGGRGAHQRGDCAVQCAVARWSRQPVNGHRPTRPSRDGQTKLRSILHRRRTPRA